MEARLRAIASNSAAIFLFHINSGGIDFEAKLGADPLYLQRAELYRDYIARCVYNYAIDARGFFAIAVHDRGPSRFDAPVFEFQKQRGAATMLLPDVDLLAASNLASVGHDDPIGFEDKLEEAIFVGATTGGIISADMVRELRHPRLRAGVYFRDKPRITFELPSIVQCDSAETVALIAALGLGNRRRSWPDQLRCKYLLSMDGNGATCSRVAIALQSNSVLVKYNSPWQLFYFHGLEAWRHYLPVRGDRDVETIVEYSAETRSRDREIAERSMSFARSAISDAACERYTAELLRHYFSQFGMAKTT